MPTPRKQKSRADLVRTLLPASDVPDSYIEAYDTVLAKDGGRDGKIAAGGVASVFASAGIAPERQGKIMAIIAPAGGEIAVGRGEFNVLLALIGLAQEGESVSLDSVDERRKSKFFVEAPLVFFFLFHLSTFDLAIRAC
jgi:sorting nexin-8